MPGLSDAVRVIEPGKTYVGKQGFTYGAGVSKETVGAKQVCLNVLPMAPGAKAKVHYHKGIETIAYVLEGECAVYYGDGVVCKWRNRRWLVLLDGLRGNQQQDLLA